MEQVTLQKKKKPKFERQEYHIRRKLQRSGWRKPRGFHSKMRKQIKGKHPLVRVGYKNPEAVRESVVLVNNLLELKAAKSEAHRKVMISGAVGTKKRVELAKEAKKLGISLANIPDVDKYLKTVEEWVKQQKADRIARVAKKSGKDKKKEKKTEAKEEVVKDAEQPKEEAKPEVSKEEAKSSEAKEVKKSKSKGKK